MENTNGIPAQGKRPGAEKVLNFPVRGSSLMEKGRYFPKNRNLEITFRSRKKDQPGAVYVYRNVPIEVVLECFQDREDGTYSPGTYFKANIEKKYKYERKEDIA